MRNEKDINITPLRLTVIARAGKAFNGLLRYFSPWQPPATEHDVRQLKWFARFTPYLRGLLQACVIYCKHLLNISFRNDGVLSTAILSVLCVFPLRSLRLKHALFLITILLITNNQLPAQSPYTGGSGDGHAMGELVLRNVGVNELGNADGYFIYPSQAKAGEAIYITSPAAGEFQLIDITGRIIYTQTLQQPVQQLPVVVTQAGLCIGIIRTQTGTYTQKIIVVE